MKRILLADDSATARMFMRRCLEIAGCSDAEFLEAEHGREALEILKREKNIDLVVTDLTMPEMDGTALLKSIAASPLLNGVPVFVATSAANEAKEKELKELGAICIMSKPINPSVVAEALEQVESMDI